MVVDRLGPSICKAIFSVSKMAWFIDLWPRQSLKTTVWIAKSRTLFAGLAKDISAANNVRNLVAKTLEHMENHLLLLGRQTALEKVASFLLEIDHRLEQPNVMMLPMGRRDIADYLGLTLETVSRALSTLRDEGILSVGRRQGRQIVLHDRAKLAERAVATS
jgi:CRP/FNR family nitrogen fixation transcriptional regulator